MQCDRCRYHNGNHDVACPESMSGVTKLQAMVNWTEGYRAGRSGEAKPHGASRTYSLGYGIGVVSLEEAENGCPDLDWGHAN